KVDGVDSTGATLMYLDEAQGELSNLVLRRLYDGLKTEGYCDRVTLRRIDCASWRSGGWLYEQGGNGDGFIGEQLFFYLTPGVYLKKCAGGTIDGMIGGAHKFEDCQGITVKNAHI